MCVRLYFIRDRLAMNVIDQILADLRQESCVFCRLAATDPWRIQKSASSVAPFYAVLSGKARIETADSVYDLYEGDFLVLPSGESHEMTSFDSANAPSVSLVALLNETGVEPYRRGMRYREVVQLQHGGGGSQSVILVGIFSFGDPPPKPATHRAAACACHP
ncbi:cupin domain-containing protein [Leptolyngbya sp. FACHB-671]|uniref:cupin domain-containing protein n=1 Tax=Leptolyngbya sp. FACHB-671 TaxID=2692812 RepID=UPI00168955A1|nr:cupin domain-containing protein [Leptolyngbya sp. FACHB-671]